MRRTFLLLFSGIFLLLLAILFLLFFPGPLRVSYQMPRDGRLTLGLFSKDGKLLRWLVQDSFHRTGNQRQFWNGLDQWGNLLSAGDYLLKGIFHPALSTEYQGVVCNPGNPPWPTSDGRGDWLCDEANPQAAVTDGKWIFLGSSGCEKGFSIIALDETGQRRWGTNEPEHFHPRCISLALDGNFLYAVYSGPEAPDPDHHPGGKNAYGRAMVACFDKQTGRPAKFSRGDPLHRIATWPYKREVSWLWDLRNNRSFSPATYAGQPRYACIELGEPTNALGIAVQGNRLFVSMLHDNKILILDANSGEPTGDALPVNAPAGLCFTSEDTLLAVSGTQVVKIEVGTKRVSPFITFGLVAPDCIAIDRGRNIYISDWGTSFQVKVFDWNGHFLRAIGKEGGRPWVGKWEADGMLVPRGIAVTDNGMLWVAEDDGSPKRVSVWDAKSGKFIRDYIGPAPYGGGTYFWIDPKDPARVNAEGTRFKVDYAAKSYAPEAVAYRRRNRNDPFTPVGHNLQNCQVRILYHDGHEYAIVNVQHNMFSVLQRQGDIYRPVSALGSVQKQSNPDLKSNGTGQIVWDSDVGYRNYEGFFPDCFAGHGGENYTWFDSNGDNLVQPEEMRWLKPAEGPYRDQAQGTWASYWGIDISPDWNIYFPERFNNGTVIYRLAPRGWTAAGAPIYDISDARPVVHEPPGDNPFGLHVTTDGKLVVCYDFESRRCSDAIRCYDLDGHLLWSVAMPKRLAGKNVHANSALYDLQIPELGDVICTWLYHGSMRPFLITSDGLYVGTLLDDTLLARTLHFLGVPIQYYVCTFLDTAPRGPTALWSESGKYFYQAPGGDSYIVNGGNQQEYILRIKGLEPDSVGRFEIPFHLSGGDVSKAANLQKWVHLIQPGGSFRLKK